MTLTTSEQLLLDEIRKILSARAEYNDRWRNVKTKIKSRYLEITWFDDKYHDDPDGRIYFSSRRVAPLNKTTLSDELHSQKKKLKRDKKRVGQ